ncbi:MAG: glycoside hydrolase, partial [Planctomycetota bacterium]|nr:glycoside hydrolase [Planctomycetota bacterium]
MSSRSILDDVDPFIGTEPMDVPVPQGLASAWFFPKPMIGNTHPGATRPMGMVSACAYTGGYPTGYGRWGKCLQGLPPELHPEKTCIGFTHFQQSGVGAIRKYYNYARVVPGTKELGGLDA